MYRVQSLAEALRIYPQVKNRYMVDFPHTHILGMGM